MSEIAEQAEKAGMTPPGMLIVGEVAALHPEVSWFEQRPLFGKRIVLTRSRDQAGGLRDRLISLGAEVLEMPLIEVVLEDNPPGLAEYLDALATYEWIIFTSQNGVRGFMRAFFETYEDIRLFGPARIACVGPATARELETWHLKPDLIPETHTAEALAKALINDGDLENQNVLIATGNLNRNLLTQTLETQGRTIVDAVAVYRTSLRELDEDPVVENFRAEGADAILFTSSSTVTSFARQAKNLQLAPTARTPKAFSIGPQTSAAMDKAGLPRTGEARQHNLDGLIEVLLEHIAQVP